MRAKFLLMVVAAVAVVSGCSADRRALTRDREIRNVWTLASDAKYIRVRGIGAAPEEIKDQTRRRGLSRNSALVAARYEMAVLLKGVRLHGGLTVADLIQRDSKIREVMDRVIAGAEEELLEFAKDDGAVVMLRIERSKVEDMLTRTARAESRAIDTASLEEQVRLAEARSREMRGKLPGMGE